MEGTEDWGETPLKERRNNKAVLSWENSSVT